MPYDRGRFKGEEAENQEEVCNQTGTAFLDADQASASIPSCQAVLFAYLNASSVLVHEVQALVARAREQAPAIVAGLNGAFSPEAHAVVLRALPMLDAVTMNLIEARWVASTDSAGAALDFVARHCAVAVVTAGARGAFLFANGSQIFLPALPLSLTDAIAGSRPQTLAAGDRFLAGLCWALAKGEPPRHAADAARLVAARWVAGRTLAGLPDLPLPAPYTHGRQTSRPGSAEKRRTAGL